MKPLNLKETSLKEEMKERCLAKGQYIDENAKAKFKMLCHLEDFEVQYWELQQENKQLKYNWNKLKEDLINDINYWQEQEKEWIKLGFIKFGGEANNKIIFKKVLDKMKGLEQGSDSNV